MRILGKGKTALALKEIYPEAILYDDNDKEIYDIKSDELTVVSPGIPPYNYLVQNTKNIISDYDLFLDDNMFTIWISGTNGKTTTTQMIYHLLKENGALCGGNIGIPLASLVGDNNINKYKVILETSSFTLHYTNKVKPNIYILLPISEDHITWHGSYQEYEQAKLTPLDKMGKDDIAIIPIKYKDYKTNAKIISYSSSDDLAKHFSIDINRLKYKEPFLLDCILAMGVDKILYDRIKYDCINNFVQDPHKVEEFFDKKNRLWVDDSKATNIDATLQALKSYKDKKIYLILGGDDKGANLEPLFIELINYNVECYFIGTNSKRLFEYAKKFNIKGVISANLQIAVQNINNDNIEENTVSILSPAAASLDQFSSYKHRGEEFKRFVNLLKY